MRWVLRRVAGRFVILLALFMVPLCAEAALTLGFDDELRGALILMLTGLLAVFGAAWMAARYLRKRRKPMSELSRIENELPAWTTTADGNNVTRAEYLDILLDEAVRACNPLDELYEAIQSDKRKSFSKKVLLELIKEYR